MSRHKRRTIEEERSERLHIPYNFIDWKKSDFSFLTNVKTYKHKQTTYNDIIIAVDTETSKSKRNDTFIEKKKQIKSVKYNPVKNHLVCWTVSISTYDQNLITVYGRKPSELVECMEKIHEQMDGKRTLFYVHNLPYDYVFIRQYLFQRFGYPVEQLNVKSHYMINVVFANGITLRDSLILSQRKLEKWANDLNVEHKKAVGSWDYDLLRNQTTDLNDDELTYIENDTLALNECLIKFCENLKRKVFELPLTNTGITRNEIKQSALNTGWKNKFNQIVLDYEDYHYFPLTFHGGYVHANRFFANQLILDLVRCYDFASSYPYVLLVEQFPMGKYSHIDIYDYNTILDMAEDYSFIFKATFVNVRLKADAPMSYLQYSKTLHTVNVVLDNGRIIEALLCSIYLSEIDFKLISEMYDFDEVIIEDCMYTYKDYLPKWFTDTVYKFFYDKCTLKGVDDIQYMIAKGLLNSCYGLCAQRSIRPVINEDYETGEFIVDDSNMEETYNKWKKRKNTVLPYQWSIYVTAYATRNLFELGSYAEVWLYSDTDSAYGINFDEKKIKAYNNECKRKLKSRGYGAVKYKGKEFWLGVAESEGDKDLYTEFKTLGAKRYVGRCKADNKLHLTVSGVPKKAVEQLENNIDNFKQGFVFKGEQSGKLTHFYMYDEMTIDENGNEVADSIDLCPCDYLLSSPYDLELSDLLVEEEGVIVYE